MNAEQELRFVQHLFSCVKSELTGRGLTELLDEGPRDRLHAGVLLPTVPDSGMLDNAGVPIPPRAQNLLEESSSAGVIGSTAVRVDSQSAMSVDFQVCVPRGIDRFLLRLEPRMTVWYAVYPTREEAATKHASTGVATPAEDGGGVDGAGRSGPRSVGTGDLASDVADEETVPNIDPATGAAESGSIPQQLAAAVERDVKLLAGNGKDVVVLPRKFHKREIVVEPIEVAVRLHRLNAPLEIRDELDAALYRAREAIVAEDSELWRHLGSPGEGRREIDGRDALKQDDSFAKALAASGKGEIALPTWRAYMTVSGEPALLASGAAEEADRGQVLRMNVALVNATSAIPYKERRRAQLEEHALFDCGFSVAVDGCEILPFEFQGTPADYRYDRSFTALGSNCVALAIREPEQPNLLITESVPLFEQPWYRTRNDFQVGFADLDDRPSADVLAVLGRIARRMESYLGDWDGFLRQAGTEMLDPAQLAVRKADRENFASEVEGFKLGIEVLSRDSRLLRAFRLMNRVFLENGQRRAPQITHWRLFQLAFMVIQLPSLAAREHDLQAGDAYSRRLAAALERVDVLWFPTGGGKTEAYLGLIATALFYDRLRHKDRGVTAWMRFPLRMLSLQQLERLARVVARAELIRADEPDLNRPGSDPFGIGYYVGGGNTPNRIREQDLPRGAPEKGWERQQILHQCPFCEVGVHITFRREDWRLVHTCDNPACYTNTSASLGALRGGLPIFVVDNEVYRYRPSVLVGTVDKLAVLGFQKYFAHLLTAVDSRCPIHGYASFGQCVEGSGGGPCSAKPKEFTPVPTEADPAPALLIQDELHLLKEELGTFNAHYEGFLAHLPSKQGYKASKILAATATIEAYETQCFHLYMKPATRFPQPSWREGESFYATSTPLRQRRLYAGVLTHQRSPEDAVLRALEVYNRQIRRMRERPDQALAALGLSDVPEAEFLSFLHLYDLSVAYVNRKGTGGNIVYRLGQSGSAGQAGGLDAVMLTGDNTMTEVGEVIQRIERERADVGASRLDVLVATSLISHGVDLERINFLCMAGMPSRFAEYIQASSRAARSHVGLVLVCFKRGDLRERSQFHYFLPNHRYLDRLVEPVPINRFSAFASKRTVPGLLVGMLLSHYSRVLYRRGDIAKPLDNLRELQKAIDDGKVTEQELAADLEAIIGVQHRQISSMQRQHLVDAITAALDANWGQVCRDRGPRLTDAIHPMLSFRDIDETLPFIGDGPAAAFVDTIHSN